MWKFVTYSENGCFSEVRDILFQGLNLLNGYFDIHRLWVFNEGEEVGDVILKCN